MAQRDISSTSLCARLRWPSDACNFEPAQGELLVDTMESLLQEHQERLVKCLEFYTPDGDLAAQTDQIRKAPEPTEDERSRRASLSNVDDESPAASGDLQHCGKKVKLSQMDKSLVVAAARELGVGPVAAMHLLMCYRKAQGGSETASVIELVSWYSMERQAAMACVVELALGRCDYIDEKDPPRARCIQVQREFIGKNRAKLLEALLRAFSPVHNGAQWWEPSDTVAPQQASGASLLAGAGALVKTGGGAQPRTMFLPEMRAADRAPHVLHEITFHLQGIFSLLYAPSGDLDPGAWTAKALEHPVLGGGGGPSDKEPLVALIKVLNITLWGTARPSLARLLPADESHRTATSVRQLAVLVVLLALQQTPDEDVQRLVDALDQTMESLSGEGAAKGAHGVIRMGWALRLVRLQGDRIAETDSDANRKWQMIIRHWEVSVDDLQAVAFVKDTLSDQGVASGKSSDVAQRLFPGIVVAYKSLLKQLMDEACHFALVLYPRDSLFQRASPDLLYISQVLFSGTSGADHRSAFWDSTASLEVFARPVPLGDQTNMTSALAQQCVFSFPMQLDPLLRLLTALLWNEPAFAARVIGVLDHLRYFCAPDLPAERFEHAHRLLLPGSQSWKSGEAAIAQQSWEGALPEDKWRSFILPEPRQGVDRAMTVIEKELRISAADGQGWGPKTFTWDRMYALNGSVVQLWLWDGDRVETAECSISNGQDKPVPLLQGQTVRLTPIHPAPGVLTSLWLGKEVVINLASRTRNQHASCAAPLPYRPAQDCADEDRKWDTSGRWDLNLSHGDSRVNIQLQLNEEPEVLPTHSSWSGFSWCQQFAACITARWKNAPTATIQQNIASQLTEMDSLLCVVSLLARLAQVVSHKHWFDSDTSEQAGKLDQEEQSELCAHLLSPTRASGDGWPGFSEDVDHTQDLTHYEVLFELWREKQQSCIIPTATTVFEGAARVLTACRGDQYTCFDAQGSTAALLLIGRSVEMLWPLGCVRSPDQTPLEASLQLVSLLHQLQLLSVGKLGAMTRMIWQTECAVGSYSGSCALLELLHQLLVSPVHEDWRSLHAVRVAGGLKDLRHMSFATRNECWVSRNRDSDPTARWRITQANLCLISDSLALYLAAEPGSTEQQLWCDVLNDVDLGLALSKLLAALWFPLQASGGDILQEVLESLLLLILTLLRCDALKHVILQHVVSEDYSSPKIQGLCSAGVIEHQDSSLSPSPEVIVGEIAKYAGHVESGNAQLEQLSLRILTELACVRANEQPPRMLPLHQWLSLGKVRGVPEWRDIVAKVCGEARLEELANGASSHSAALLLQLVRKALVAYNSVGLLLCLPSAHDEEQGRIMRFAYEVVSYHSSCMIKSPRLLLEALLLIEAHTLAMRGPKQGGGSFVLMLEDHLAVTTQVVELQLAVTALVNEGWAETASSTKGQGIVEHVDIDLVGQSAVVFVGTHEQVHLLLSCAAATSKMTSLTLNNKTTKIAIPASPTQGHQAAHFELINSHCTEILKTDNCCIEHTGPQAGQTLQLLAAVLSGKDLFREAPTEEAVAAHSHQLKAVAAAARLMTLQLHRRGKRDPVTRDQAASMLSALLPQPLPGKCAETIAENVLAQLGGHCFVCGESVCTHTWLDWLYVSPQLSVSWWRKNQPRESATLLSAPALLQWVVIGTEEHHQGLLMEWKDLYGVQRELIMLTTLLEAVCEGSKPDLKQLIVLSPQGVPYRSAPRLDAHSSTVAPHRSIVQGTLVTGDVQYIEVEGHGHKMYLPVLPGQVEDTWLALDDALADLTREHDTLEDDPCVRGLELWMAAADEDTARQSVVLWLLQTSGCRWTEKELNQLPSTQLRDEALRVYCAMTGGNLAGFTPTIQDLASECHPKLSVTAKQRLKSMATQLKSVLNTVRAFVLWLNPATTPDLKLIARLFEQAANWQSGTGGQPELSKAQQWAKEGGVEGLSQEQACTEHKLPQYGEWLRHNVKVALLADQNRAIAKSTQWQHSTAQCGLRALHTASDSAAARAVLKEMNPTQTEERLLSGFYDSTELTLAATLPSSQGPLDPLYALLCWKQRSATPLLALPCATLQARFSYYQVSMEDHKRPLGCVNSISRLLVPAEKEQVLAVTQLISLSAMISRPHTDQLAGLIQEHRFEFCAQLSANLAATNPYSVPCDPVSSSCAATIKSIACLLASADDTIGQPSEAGTMQLLKTFVSLVGFSSATASAILSPECSPGLLKLHGSVLAVLELLLHHESVLRCEELQRLVLPMHMQQLLETLISNSCSSFTTAAPAESGAIHESAAAAVIGTLFFKLNKAPQLRSACVGALLGQTRAINALLATVQESTVPAVSVVNMLLVIGKESPQPLTLQLGASAQGFLGMLCNSRWSATTPDQDKLGAQQSRKCWLLLLALTSNEMLRLHQSGNKLLQSVGYDFLLAHLDRIKSTLFQISDVAVRASNELLDEASAIFQLLVLVCAEPHTLARELRADIAKLSLHTFHGLVSRVAFLTQPTSGHFGTAFDWVASEKTFCDKATEHDIRSCAFAKLVTHSSQARSPRVVESMTVTVKSLFVLLRNTCSVLRLLSPIDPKDSLEVPIFSPSKDVPFGGLNELHKLLYWMHGIGTLLSAPSSAIGAVEFHAGGSNIAERLCQLLLQASPSHRTASNERREWLVQLRQKLEKFPELVGALTLLEAHTSTTAAPAAHDSASSSTQQRDLAALASTMADMLHRCGEHQQSLECGWLGWVLAGELVIPEMLVVVEHATAMLVSSVKCFIAQGPSRLSAASVDPNSAVPEGGIVTLWSDVTSIVKETLTDLERLSALPVFRESEDTGYSVLRFETVWENLQQNAPEGVVTVAACINATRYAVLVDDKLDGRNDPRLVNRFLPECDSAVEIIARELFPVLHQSMLDNTGSDKTAMLLADQLRQQLLKSQLQRHTHKLEIGSGQDQNEQLSVARALLDHVRLYVRERAEEVYQDDADCVSDQQALDCLEMITNEEANCIKVAGQPNDYVQYTLATALVIDPGKLKRFQGDAMAACLSLLPNVPKEMSNSDLYPNQATAMELRRCVCNKLYKELTLDKHTFEQLAEQIKLTLLSMSNHAGEAPEQLEGVSLSTLLSSCEYALQHTQLHASDEGRRAPSLVWGDRRRDLELVQRFVQSSEPLASRQQFVAAGGLLDPKCSTTDGILELLAHASKICEFVAKLFVSDLDNMSLETKEQTGPEALKAERDALLDSIPELKGACHRYAGELRAEGRWTECVKLDNVGCTAAYVGAAAEHLRQLEGELHGIKSGFGRRGM